MKTGRVGASLLHVLCLVAVGLPSPYALYAQPLELLGDLNTDSIGLSGPGVLTIGTVNGKALLHAPSEGIALWATDGTGAGTLPIADVGFGGGLHATVVNGSPQRALVIVGSVGQVFGGRVLRTDGSRAGTFILRNQAGVPLVPFQSQRGAGDEHGLYFLACARDVDCGVWFNDGNGAASQLLATLDPGSFISAMLVLDGSFYWSIDSRLLTTRFDQPGARLVFGATSESILGLMQAGGRLYFSAGSTSGAEAWTSDGTSAGTRVLTAFPNPSPFSTGVVFQAEGGRIYFLADDVVHGRELWSTDGTAAGTRRETDFGFHQPFGPESVGGRLPVAVVGSKLMFVATDGLAGYQLWVKSGAAEPVALLDPCGPDCSPASPTGGILAANGKVFFGAADPNHGYELWSSDGTKNGTRRLTDACPGSCAGWWPAAAAGHATVAGGRAFFWATTDLWVSDGSPDGTHRLYHDEALYPLFVPGMSRVFAVGERFVFPARDPVYGKEVFVANDSLDASEPVADLLSAAAGSQPTAFTSLGGRAIFAASSGFGAGVSLWTTDGTAADTAELPLIRVAACVTTGRLCQEPVAAGNYLFFMQRDERFDYQLWRTDGTAAGSLQLTDVEGLPSAAGIAVGARLYFTRFAFGSGIELWSSDGTAARTRALFVLPGLVSAASFTAVGSELYFIGSTGSSAEAWRTDGTLAGTRPVTAFAGTSHQVVSNPMFVRAGSEVWFVARGPAAGELWRTDGTTAGTQLVATPNLTSDLVSHDGVLYFLAQASPQERALWRVNEARDGITQLDRFPGSGGFPAVGAGALTVWQDRLYLVANGVEGHELWQSDGTVGGAHLVRDINPGADGSGIDALHATPYGLFFSANDGSHGWELWRSDGTAAGTRLVHDLQPGPIGSFPSVGAVAGTHLLIAATEDGFGREPWSLDLVAPRACAPGETALCLNGGRFRVTADWKDFAGNRGVGHAVALTNDTGYFWFFGPPNVEAVVKVLDGHGVNGHDWVFYGALSSVEYTLTVTDTQTGAVRRYFNPSGRLASVGDIHGFGPLGGYARTPPPSAAPAPAARRIASADTSPCVASATRLCLNGGRFAVEATWKDFGGHTGVGHAVNLTGDTGYLWFFSDSNVEVVIKVLDGRPLNGKFWLFYGALSSVEYTLTVRDTVTGAVRVYRNTSGNMASVADVAAF